ncbi:unnamed protein product [Camellia sinensis]
MANKAQIPSRNSALIAMIADESSSTMYYEGDTVTGFLLAGVGNVDLRRKTNYLIVDSKTTVKQIEDAFKEFTTREDIAIVMISQFVANMIRFLVDSYNKPVPAILEIPSKDHPYDPTHDSVLSRVKYLFSAESVTSGRQTTVKQIEDAFKEFTTREDIAIVMISQFVANMIRFLVDSYNKPVPAILEIPSKDHPYDPTHDSVLSRVKYLFSAESVASGRR